MMKIIPCIFSIILIFCISCGKNENSGEPRDSDQTIIFKHFKLANSSEQFEKTIRSFQNLNPNITVKEEILPANTDIQHQYYATSLEARSDEFDVFLIDVIWTPEFSLAGWLEDLSELIPPEERNEFFSGPIQADTYKGSLYAVPWYVDGGLFYYRKDLLGKYGFQPPATFDEMVYQAQTILAGENRKDLYGFLWQGKQYEGLICAANEIIGGFGGRILDGDNRLHLEDAETKNALQWMRDTIHLYKISPGWVTTSDEETTRLSFFNGNCIFLRNWPYCWTFFQLEDSPVKGKVGVSPMLSLDGESSLSTLGGWQIAVNRFSKNKEAAKKFVRYMTTPEILKEFALNVGIKPARKALYSDAQIMKDQPFITELYGILEMTRPRPVSPFYQQISQILQIEFSAVLGDIRPVDEAMRSATLQIEHILALEKSALKKRMQKP
ncbi:MAG: ABC transporter substrate-binding protein [Calditrichaceae bacterium]